jgi:hypothetical protein
MERKSSQGEVLWPVLPSSRVENKDCRRSGNGVEGAATPF